MSTQELTSILEQVCNAHKHIRQILGVDPDHIEESQRSDILYPCAFIENPTLSNGNFDCEIAILQNVNEKQAEEQQLAIDYTWRIAEEIKAQLERMRDICQLNLLKFEINTFLHFTADDIFGASLVFTIENIFEDCSINNFDDNFPFGFVPRLEIEHLSGTTTTQDASFNKPASYTAVEVKYKIGDEAVVTTDDLSLTLTTEGKRLSILAKFTIGTYEFYSSIIMPSTVSGKRHITTPGVKIPKL